MIAYTVWKKEGTADLEQFLKDFKFDCQSMEIVDSTTVEEDALELFASCNKPSIKVVGDKVETESYILLGGEEDTFWKVTAPEDMWFICESDLEEIAEDIDLL